MIEHTTEISCDVCYAPLVRETQTQMSGCPLAVTDTRVFRVNLGGSWWDMCHECRQPLVDAARKLMDERDTKLKP